MVVITKRLIWAMLIMAGMVVDVQAEGGLVGTCDTPVRIMPVGDSITVGASSGVEDPALQVGYRQFLDDKLADEGYSVDFVGSQTQGNGHPNFDFNNEGHPGKSAGGIADQIYNWLESNPADMLLLHAGTNALVNHSERISILLNEIDRYETENAVSVQVVLAQIVNNRSGNSLNTSEFNRALYNMAATRIAAGDQLVLVDVEHALTYPDDMYDNLHPQASGYAKMANVWMAQLRRLLPVCNTPVPVVDTDPPVFFPIAESELQPYLDVPPVVSIEIDDAGGLASGYWQLDSNPEQALFDVTASTLFNADFSLPQADFDALSGGLHTLRFRAIDNAGNPSSREWKFVRQELPVRVNVGGPSYTDSLGQVWSSDYGFNTGKLISISESTVIGGTPDPELYRSGRYDVASAPEMNYAFNVPNGDYQVKLHFAETYSGIQEVGQRVFDVNLEDVPMLVGLDIYAKVGANNIALVETRSVTVNDGMLDITFIRQIENPAVQAIEIFAAGSPDPDLVPPSTPTNLSVVTQSDTRVDLSWNGSTDTGGSGLAGYHIYRDGIEVGTSTSDSYADTRLIALTTYLYTVEAYDFAENVSGQSGAADATTLALPSFSLRINVGGLDYTDGLGQLWSADYSYNETSLRTSEKPGFEIRGTNDDELYWTGRFDTDGGILYGLTVPNGDYQVKLHFAETYRNTKEVGKRVFNVSLEGVVALAGLDIYAEAGADTMLVKTLPVTVSDGKLNIDFLHQVENPVVRAIEVIAGSVVPDTDAPSIPSGLNITAQSDTRVSLNWSASTDMGGSGLAGYRVYRDGVEVGTSSNDSYTDTGLTVLTTYLYTVEAYDNAGNASGQSSVTSVTTLALDLVSPSTPTNLSAVAQSDTRVDLSWNGSTDTGGSGLAGYHIYRDGIEVGTSTSDSYADTRLIALTTYLYTVEAYDFAENVSGQSGAADATTLAPPSFSLRINVGSLEDYTDDLGQLWSADDGYNETSLRTSEKPGFEIHGTNDDELYRMGRFDTDVGILYGFTVPNGDYQVKLHFAETYRNTKGEGKRVFNVSLEGVVALTSLDIYAEAGADTMLVKTLPVTVSDGKLNIDFLHLVENPVVRAIEVIAGSVVPDTDAPSIPGGLNITAQSDTRVSLNWSASTDDMGGSGLAGYRVYRDGVEVGTSSNDSYTDTGLTVLTTYLYTVEAYDFAENISGQSLAVSATTLEPASFSLRINVGGLDYTDDLGQLWSADYGYNTGRSTSASTAINGTSNPMLYQTGRFDVGSGSEMRYSLAVPNGDYQVRLHFAETYSGIKAAGQRVFNVSLEGVVAPPSLDIYAETGANNTALVKTLPVTAVSDGELNIDFLHLVENPVVHAIEIVGL